MLDGVGEGQFREVKEKGTSVISVWWLVFFNLTYDPLTELQWLRGIRQLSHLEWHIDHDHVRCMFRTESQEYADHLHHRREATSLQVRHLELSILCVQDHNFFRRFFPKDRKDGDKKGNLLAGTVVDKGITHPTDHDFYLQSHGGIIGTSRPSHYTVHLLSWHSSGFVLTSIQVLEDVSLSDTHSSG